MLSAADTDIGSVKAGFIKYGKWLSGVLIRASLTLTVYEEVCSCLSSDGLLGASFTNLIVFIDESSFWTRFAFKRAWIIHLVIAASISKFNTYSFGDKLVL